MPLSYPMHHLAESKWIQLVVWILFVSICLVFPSISYAAVELDLLPASDKTGKWGYIDAKTKKTVIAPKYASVEFFEEGVALVRYAHKDKAQKAVNQFGEKILVVPVKYGLIDRTGREILLPEYEKIEIAKASGGEKEKIPKLFKVTQGDEEGYFHADGHWLLPLGQYERLQLNKNGNIWYGDCLWTAGKEYCAPGGYEVQNVDYKRKTFLIKSKPGLRVPVVGLIKWTGESIIPPDYQDITSIDQPVQRWVASRLDGKIAKKVLSAVLSQSEIKVDKTKDNITFFIFDENGEKIVSHQARDYPKISKDRISYQSQGKDYTISALTGEVIHEANTKTIGGKYTLFEENGYQGLKNAMGQIVLPAIYFKVKSLGGDLFAASTLEGVDTRKPASSYNSYAAKYGAIDAAGRIIIPFQNQDIEKANYPNKENSLLIVRSAANRYGLADRTGRLLTPAQYLNTFYFNKQGKAIVYHASKGEHGVIDHTGKEILPTEYRTIFDTARLGKTEDVFYMVKKDKKWGVYDSSGKEVIPVKYGDVNFEKGEFGKGWVEIKSDNRQMRGAYNYLTKVSIPLEYDSLGFHKHGIVGYKTIDGKSQAYLLDLKGKVIGIYDRIESTSSLQKGDEILVRKEGKLSLLDAYGKTLIPFKYKYLEYAAPSYWWAGEGKQTRTLLVGKNGVEYRIKE